MKTFKTFKPGTLPAASKEDVVFYLRVQTEPPADRKSARVEIECGLADLRAECDGWLDKFFPADA